jgi:hypothetical protein
MQPREPHGTPPQTPEQQPTDYSKPVAYDNEGRPLYAHPPVGNGRDPQMVYVSRPLNPEKPQIPEKILQKCEESKRRYPQLNLSHGEYVISAVKRHPIGLIKIWAFVAILILVFGTVVSLFIVGSNDAGSESLLAGFGDAESLKTLGTVIMIMVSVLGLLGGFVASYVYNANRFYLTNESVVQLIQTSLFSMHEQTVSLQNIEDASYEQHGILPQLLNYGRIRLSTEGDETTYRFAYVSNPKREIATLNNAVEAFKNGRPVMSDSDT